jgi:hypothetical protein
LTRFAPFINPNIAVPDIGTVQSSPKDIVNMNITRGPYSANVAPIPLGKRGIGFQVVVCRYGTPLYEHSESDFEEAIRVAKAYIEWELDNHTDA